MRRQRMLVKVKNIVYASVLVTDKEVEDQYKREKERATIKYIAFPPAKFKDQVTVSPAICTRFSKGIMRSFHSGKRSFQVLIADQAKMEQSMVISDSDLRAVYAGSMDNFRMPERVKARHILIKTQGKSDAERSRRWPRRRIC